VSSAFEIPCVVEDKIGLIKGISPIEFKVC
jgi:hypothetical protein